MQAIQQALTKLDASIGKLETALVRFEEDQAAWLARVQQDMFDPAQVGGDNVVVLDRQDVKKRLDQAIEKVEKILKEA